MTDFPKNNRNQTTNLQRIVVRMNDGTKKNFYNTDGWHSYSEIRDELKSVSGIKTLLVDVTKVK